MKLRITFSLLFLFFAFTNYSQCKDSTSDYLNFRGKWNKKVEIFRAGTWKLPPIDCSLQKRDSFEIVHPLERAGINYMSTLTKTGCVNKASILVKKADDLEIEGLVGMMLIIELFNPELNSNERQKVLSELKADSEAKKSYSTKAVGKNGYYYEPGLIVNVLTVVVGR
jgi:hypothetical protein